MTHTLTIRPANGTSGFYGDCSVCYDVELVDLVDDRMVATGAYYGDTREQVQDAFWGDHVLHFPEADLEEDK